MKTLYRITEKLLCKAIAGVALSVAAIAGIWGCNDAVVTYSGPEYMLFSDTLYVLPVVDDQEYHNIPVVATTACDYDRTVAVEVMDAFSNAIEGRHYSLESNSVTIPAGELVGNVRVRGYHNNIDVYDSLGFKLNLIVPEGLQWNRGKEGEVMDLTGSVPAEKWTVRVLTAPGARKMGRKNRSVWWPSPSPASCVRV